MRHLLLSVVALSVGQAVFGQTTIDIMLKQGSAAEIWTREQLQRLLMTYDLSPWMYTKLILIDERSIPHSHPVLTLHTRHAKDDELLLSTFVHEQFHWFLSERGNATQEAIAALRKLFPTVPGTAAGGAADENSTYLHLVVCYLEHQAVRRILGELKAKQVMEFWAADHYTWVYRTVLERSRDIGDVIRNHKLIPTR